MEFTVKRAEWLRGEGGHPSLLFRPSDRKRCCIGFYLNACGVSDATLEDNPSPHDIPRAEIALPWSAGWLLDPGESTNLPAEANSQSCLELMRVNDARFVPLGDREQRVAALFAKHGVVVKFVE